MNAQLSCLTCGVRFMPQKADGLDSNESYSLAVSEHKSHLKGDWHRYNLKRKVLEMPAVTEEAFMQKVLQQRAQVQNEAEAFLGRCDLCHKTFASSNAFENHVKSKKHRSLESKTNVKTEVKNHLLTNEDKDKVNTEEPKKQAGIANQKTSEKTAVEEEEEEEEDEDGSEEEWSGELIGLEECLFCSKISKTMEKNIAHMTLAHGFFIPDLEYVCDLEGLITYLGQLVGEYHVCLWCKAQRFRDTQATQHHMVDKGHCKMLHESDNVIEYSDFYDYRKSYPDYTGEDGSNGNAGQDDDDEEVQLNVLEQSGYQLVLPSGATIGHRALLRYYRQKLQPERQITLHRNSSVLSKVISHYKALGWTGTTGAVAEKKAKDLAYFNRIQSRHFMQLGVKSNRLQKHFRDQVFGC